MQNPEILLDDNEIENFNEYVDESSSDSEGEVDEDCNIGASIIGDEVVDASVHEIPSFSKDIGLWPRLMEEEAIAYWLCKGSDECRNSDSGFEKSAVQCTDRVRHCTKANFTRTHSLTGESIDLSWLCYSESMGKVYCFPCKIISRDASAFTEGFNDWRNARSSIEAHNRSPQHMKSLTDITARN